MGEALDGFRFGALDILDHDAVHPALSSRRAQVVSGSARSHEKLSRLINCLRRLHQRG
jgi:hypothetical protein